MASKLLRASSFSCIRSCLNSLAVTELQSFSLARGVETATQQHGNRGRGQDHWTHATRQRFQIVNPWEHPNKSAAVGRLYHSTRQPVAPQPLSGTRVAVYERPTRSTVKSPPIKVTATEKKPVHGVSTIVQALKETGWSRKEVLNLPNTLSLSRALAGPIIYSWILQGQWEVVLPAIGGAALTDWLDGVAARKLNQHSVLGSYLDPVADKILIGCVTLGMAKVGLLPLPLAVVIVGRDVGLVIGGFVMRARSLKWHWPGFAEFFRLAGGAQAAPSMAPLLISKANTCLQLTLVGGCAMHGVTHGSFPPPDLLYGLGVVTAGTTIWSAAAYLRAFLAGSTGLAVKGAKVQRSGGKTLP